MTTTVFSSSVTYYGDGVDPLFSFAADGDSLVVNAGVTVSNLGLGDIAYAFQRSDISATINGTLSAKDPDATINAYYSGLDLTVGSTGRVEAFYGDAVRIGPTGTVANHGSHSRGNWIRRHPVRLHRFRDGGELGHDLRRAGGGERPGTPR